MIKKNSVLLNSDDFSNNIDKFDKKRREIEDLLEKITISMNKINGHNEIWNSDTQRMIYDDYKGIEKRYNGINAEFTSYSIFLKEVLEKHKEEENSQITFLDKNDSNMNIN